MARSDQADRADPDIAAIRKSNAASLRVYLSDGTEKAVAITKAGNRWAKLQDTLASMQWERIECLDAKGAILATLESDEDFVDDDADEGGGKLAKMAKLMLSLMKETMAETRKGYEVQMKGYADLIGSMTEGLNQLAQAHRLAMQVQVAHIAKQTSDDEGNPMNQVLQMLAMQMLPQMLPTSAPKAPPTGKGHP